jgi:hypothetical protein
MPDKSLLYSRDLLYPTDVLHEPGSVHIDIFNPDKNARIPVVIESKSDHSPVKYIDSIIRIMQADIFDRIFINVKNNTCIYIKNNEKQGNEYGDKKYLVVVFDKDGIKYRGVDDIME